MAARRKEVKASPFRQEQDEWDRRLWKATGLAIGQWLIDARINLSRPIQSLTAAELTGMSWAAVGEYLNRRQQRELELRSRPDPLLPARWNSDANA
jgi:hypothetical protein